MEPTNFPLFKWQYRAGAEAGAGAKIKKKVEPELEPKLNNFGSVTLMYYFWGPYNINSLWVASIQVKI